MTSKSPKDTIWMYSNYPMYLSDHLMNLLKWKYEVRPFQIRIERPQKCTGHL